MDAYKVDAVVEKGGTLTIRNLPFREGERLEVILLQREGDGGRREDRPLRGEPVRYADPFGGVAEDDWNSAG